MTETDACDEDRSTGGKDETGIEHIGAETIAFSLMKTFKFQINFNSNMLLGI